MFTAFLKRIFCLYMNYTHMFGLKFRIERIACSCVISISNEMMTDMEVNLSVPLQMCQGHEL
jgi:hypothetical protein